MGRGVRIGPVIPWTEEEKSLLLSLWPKVDSLKEAAESFPSRSPISVKGKAQHLQAGRMGRLLGMQDPEWTVTDTGLAWLAGFLDGEGTLILRPHRKSISVAMLVTNTHEMSIRRVQDLIGYGTVRESDRHTRWRKVYCYEEWGTRKVSAVLRRIEPFMVTKQEHARVILEAVDGEISFEEAYPILKKLNARGAAVEVTRNI